MFLSVCCACHFFHVHVFRQKNDRNIPSWRNLKSYWTWIPCVSSVVDSVQVRSGDLVPWGGVVMEMKYCLSWWWCLWWSGLEDPILFSCFPVKLHVLRRVEWCAIPIWKHLNHSNMKYNSLSSKYLNYLNNGYQITTSKCSYENERKHSGSELPKWQGDVCLQGSWRRLVNRPNQLTV